MHKDNKKMVFIRIKTLKKVLTLLFLPIKNKKNKKKDHPPKAKDHQDNDQEAETKIIKIDHLHAQDLIQTKKQKL